MEGHTRSVSQYLKDTKLQILEPCMTGLPYRSADGRGRVVIYLAVHFDGPVDRENLGLALRDTACRFPVAERCILRIGNAFFFAKSEAPLSVGEYQGNRRLGSPENGYHSLDVSADDDHVYFAVDHGLMDGGALLRFAEYMLSRYDDYNAGSPEPKQACRQVDERTCGAPAALPPEVSAREEADPYMLSAEGEAFRVKGPAARNCQLTFASERFCDLTELAVPTEAVLSICRELKTSPTALFALLIAEAIIKIRPEDEKGHIIAEIPIDFRRALGLEDSMKNAAFSFLADLEDPGWDTLDFSRKAEILKKMIREAEDARVARGWIQFYRDLGTVWSRMAGMPESKRTGTAYTFMLSYLRPSPLKCWEGKELLFAGVSSHNDFCMTEYAGNFHLWLRPMKDENYAEAFRAAFSDHGLPLSMRDTEGPSFTGETPGLLY